MAKSADLERVTIYWYAVPNAHTSRGGWMPVYDHNGKQRGDTYGKGYDLDDALKMAKANAEDEASHYVGDWDVVVAKKPRAPGSATKRARKATPTRHHATLKLPAKEDLKHIAREAARGRAATPSARVTAYAHGPYVDEKHIAVTTTIGDLAGSHSAAYAALKKAGITPARSSAGSLRMTVDEDLPLAQAKAIVVAALRAAGIKVDA